MSDSKPKASQPCPCGSGKKYRDCCALKKAARRKLGRRSKTIGLWVLALAVAGTLVYVISMNGTIAYTDADMGVVDFSGLTASAKRAALRAVNDARCPCGCGMTLAQCVATDSTCPLRTENIQRVRTAVAEQRRGSS